MNTFTTGGEERNLPHRKTPKNLCRDFTFKEVALNCPPIMCGLNLVTFFQNTVWKGEKRVTSQWRHLTHTTSRSTSREKSHVGSNCPPPCEVIRCMLHFWSLSRNPPSHLRMKKSPYRPRLRHILQNTRPVLLKTTKVTKITPSLRNGHRPEKIEEM